MTEPMHRKLSGLAEYSAALEEVIALASREIRIFDDSLENLGFNSAARHESLGAFLRANPENRLSILVHDTAYLEKRCPRMMTLLRQFSHNLFIRQVSPEFARVYAPFCLADAEHYVRRFHFDDPRGIFARFDPHEARALLQRFEALRETADPALSPDISGL